MGRGARRGGGVNLAAGVFITLVTNTVLKVVLYCLIPSDDFGGSIVIRKVLCIVKRKFVHLVGVLIMPLMFYSLIYKDVSVNSAGGLKAMNIEALMFCLTAATLTISITLAMNGLVGPNIKLSVDSVRSSTSSIRAVRTASLASAVLGVVPSGPVGSLTDKAVLRIVMFTLVINIVLTGVKRHTRAMTGFFDRFGSVVVRVAVVVVTLTPVNMFYLVDEAFTGVNFDTFVPLTGCVVNILLTLTVRYFNMCRVLLGVFAKLGPVGFVGGFFPIVTFTFSATASGTAVPVSVSALSGGINISGGVSSFAVPLKTAVGVSNASVVRNITMMFTTRTFNVRLDPVSCIAIVKATALTSMKATNMPDINLIALAVMFGSMKLPIRTVNLVVNVSHVLSVAEATIGVANSTIYAAVITRRGNTLSGGIFGRSGWVSNSGGSPALSNRGGAGGNYACHGDSVYNHFFI